MNENIVYKITNNITSQFYVGYRKGNFEEYWGTSKALSNNILEYGRRNFTKEILRTFQSRSEAQQYELELILKFKNDELCLNNVPLNDTEQGGSFGKLWKTDRNRMIEYSNANKERIKQTRDDKKKTMFRAILQAIKEGLGAVEWKRNILLKTGITRYYLETEEEKQQLLEAFLELGFKLFEVVVKYKKGNTNIKTILAVDKEHAEQYLMLRGFKLA